MDRPFLFFGVCMDLTVYVIISFVCGMAFIRFWNYIFNLGRSTIMIKNTINDCLLMMSANLQAAHEAHEIKYYALELAERNEKYIDFQKKVDEQQLKTIQNTIIRNFISSVPHQHSHLIKFHNWETAMVELTKEIKRRKTND